MAFLVKGMWKEWYGFILPSGIAIVVNPIIPEPMPPAQPVAG